MMQIVTSLVWFGGGHAGGIGCLMRSYATVASVYGVSLDVNYFVFCASPRAVCFCCRRRVMAYQIFFFGVCLLLFSVCMATDGVCHGDAGDVNVFAPPWVSH